MSRLKKKAPEELVSVDLYKSAMRQVASPVAVITTFDGGEKAGLTATAVCSATTEPPTILVCVNRSASAEPMIAASGRLAVNFLTDDQHEVARLFSTSKLSSEKRFAVGDWTTLSTGAPVLKNTIASFDCTVESVVPCGTHNIYVSRVEAVSSDDGAPLLYRDGYFRRLGANF
ncbi:flavin reductase family protein [Oryzicola mucosus]|uniref:Flavin reductase n=1 Tax=Oryzicola mucosus TaxID=2767425 RepID=A0A8J6U144_9HYPH|nr:flavin reductase family protein [Oryzicola mucosus]MBD0413863.1 flavin reductase [Oryzicola mucosus]